MAISRMTDQIGRVVSGRYRLIAPIGTGASAEVYLAEDVRLRRRVAVKVLHAALADDDQFLRRFRAEAQAAAALNHPNIVAVYDWGEDDLPYIVTEHLGGGSLRAILDRGSMLTASQALMVGLEATRGLDYAHKRGFVHRDIKPANLLFGEDRRLRIADFGLARALAEAAWTEPAGAVLGTARYASPEQAQGQAVDGRSDIYSLGLVLIEAVTGTVPFSADTTIGTLMARVDTPVDVPEQLDALARPLARVGLPDPKDRPTAGEFGVSLMAAAELMDRPQPLPIAMSTGELDATVASPSLDDHTMLQGEVATVGTEVAAPPTTVAPAAEAKRKRRWPLIAVATIFALLVAGLGGYAIVQARIPSHKVPDLSHLTLEQATRRAEALGWKVKPHDDYKNNWPVGEVFRTSPRAGESLKEGETLDVVVSIGNEPTDVPNGLKGKTRQQAAQALQAALFKPKFTPVFSETIPKDQVMKVDADATEPLGSTINVTISAGPKPRTIPTDLAGGSFDQAKHALEALQLKASKVEVFSDDVKKGKVVGTVPAAGTAVPRGSTVQVQVSKGPDMVEVPSIRGLDSLDAAVEKIEAAGLVAGDVIGPAKGDPFTTDPEPGDKVKRGTVVDIYMKR